MSLRLIIEDDEGSTTIVPLGKESITIGRQNGNTIQLTEKNVSRRHARLTPDGDAWVIEDLGSYNGVKVNGRPVDARVVLQEGDVVQIGDYHLALTEDVDRRSLNYDRPRAAAANDGAVEPMLASSSTNLPRLSQAELAALSSGQHPQAVAPPQMIVDSGQMPMARVPPPYQEEPRRRTGMMVGLGLAVVGVVAIGSFWVVANGGFGGKSEGTQIAKNETRTADAKGSEPTKAEPAKTSVTPPPTPVTPAPAVVPADAKQDTPADPTGAQEAAPPPENDDGDVEVVDPPVEPPPTTPTKTSQPSTPKKSTPKKSNPTPPPSTPTKPTPPPQPAVDTDALLKDASDALFKNPAQAYDLANKANNAKGSTEAKSIMARAACRMGDESKARKWIKQLKGDKRDAAIKLCQIKGITIE